MNARWPHLRALLIALVLVANGIVALPFGPRVTKASLARPEARIEVDAWMGFASRLGLSRQEFEQLLIRESDRLVDWDETLTAPFKSFMGWTKTGQSWGLFAVPDADPMRFTVLGVDESGEERVLYRRLDGEHAFLRGALDFRRVRGVYDCGGSRKTLPPRYQNLAKWVARQAFAAHPDLARVVVLQTETRTTLPWQDPDPKLVERYRLTFSREDV
jgi:hypothetical protein